MSCMSGDTVMFGDTVTGTITFKYHAATGLRRRRRGAPTRPQPSTR